MHKLFFIAMTAFSSLIPTLLYAKDKPVASEEYCQQAHDIAFASAGAAAFGMSQKKLLEAVERDDDYILTDYFREIIAEAYRVIPPKGARKIGEDFADKWKKHCLESGKE